ncbi:MAG TPA: HAD-IA family hydrolase [Blastocatellia bacterium]|nr:HAD-IA family hydrolase [Blastocatellia bacterium]
MHYRCLLFDLDGTLIDSRADLTNSINLMLTELGLKNLPDEQVLSFIGEGIRLLVERALRASQNGFTNDAQIENALVVYRRHYGQHLLDQTRLYPEVAETLEALAHLPKAVVTNKPYDFTLPILDGLNLSQHFAAVIGGDSLPERKPSALPLIEAARRCETNIAECLMIGDSFVDVLAGKAAGTKTCGYVAGFRGRAELVEAGADYLIENFGELRQIVV